MAPVLADARAAEVVRDDVTVTDLVTLASIVTRVPPSAREVDARIWERFLGLALDGLRPGAAYGAAAGAVAGAAVRVRGASTNLR